MKIVNGDNFCRDYPAEWFLNVTFTSADMAEQVAEVLNKNEGGEYSQRYWRVVPDDYVLSPEFEP